VAKEAHLKTKLHKRRCKKLQDPAYTIEESERAAGLGRDTRRAGSSTIATPSIPEKEMAEMPP
jgi:bud site selection protein 20